MFLLLVVLRCGTVSFIIGSFEFCFIVVRSWGVVVTTRRGRSSALIGGGGVLGRDTAPLGWCVRVVSENVGLLRKWGVRVREGKDEDMVKLTA